MGIDVMHNCRGCYLAMIRTALAERLLLELSLADCLPRVGLVEGSPRLGSLALGFVTLLAG